MQSYLERVEAALNDLKLGKMIILTDHPDRENEGDFVIPAETITAESMNFIIRHSSGIVCLPLLEQQIKKLNLSYMVSPEENSSLCKTPFTISIDAKEGISTGVSAIDRVKTIQAAIAINATAEDIVKPGHIFPLYARAGGVLERPGHTEGAIDLARLAGFRPAAVLCEVMNPDGTMARGESLKALAAEHQLKILSIADIIHYRLLKENIIEEEVSAVLPIQKYGDFKITAVKEKITGLEHIVLEKEKNNADKCTLVRIHSACFTGDLLGSLRCDCHQQLHDALEKISHSGGILIYLNQEGRGIGLFNKIKTYLLQEQGFDTIEANQQLGLPVDAREYHIAAEILKKRQINHVRLLTNNPAKIAGLKKYGIANIVIESSPVSCNQHNQRYLQTKVQKLNHSIHERLQLVAKDI